MTTAATKDKPAARAAASKEDKPMNIYQLISLIAKEAGALAPEQKSGVPFPFRGVDGTVNHLAPHLNKYGVIVVPNVQSVTVTPREVGNRVVKTTEVITRFDFYAPDGSSLSATTAGLADDFGDRSTAQAQSVAYRIALLETFSLPTQSAEPEQTGVEVENAHAQATPAAAKPDTTVAGTLRKQIADIVQDPKNPWDGPKVNALGDQITKKERAVWMNSAADLKKVVEAMQRGEVAEAA